MNVSIIMSHFHPIRNYSIKPFTFAKNYNLPDTEDKGRQDVVTTGSLDGYYITNGKAIKIKCNKESRSAQTQYVDLEGNEIKVNDGNTWVNVCPIDANVTIAE